MESSAHVPRAASTKAAAPASLFVTLPLAILQRDNGQLFRLYSLRLYKDTNRARAYATVAPNVGDPYAADAADRTLELCGEGPDLLAALTALGVQLFGSALPFMSGGGVQPPERGES